MEENFKRLAGQVARALNLSEQTVSDYAESEDSIKELAKAFKDNRTKIDDTASARVSERIKREVEKALKDKGVEAPDFEKLSEGLDAVAAKAAANGGAALSEEEARENPVVRKLLADAENDKKQAVTQAHKDAEAGLKKDREAFFKQQEDAKLEIEYRRQIKELDPNLNPDPAKAEKQVERMVKELLAAPRKKEADGSYLPVDANGVYLDNGSGGSKSLAEFVRDTVTVDFGFDLPVSARPRQIPAAGEPSPAAGSIKTKEDYEAEVIKNQANPAALDKLEADYPQFSK